MNNYIKLTYYLLILFAAYIFLSIVDSYSLPSTVHSGDNGLAIYCKLFSHYYVPSTFIYIYGFFYLTLLLSVYLVIYIVYFLSKCIELITQKTLKWLDFTFFLLILIINIILSVHFSFRINYYLNLYSFLDGFLFYFFINESFYIIYILIYIILNFLKKLGIKGV